MAFDPWCNNAFSRKYQNTAWDKEPIYLTLLCGTKQWRISKSLVNANSEVLARMFKTSVNGIYVMYCSLH